MTSQLCRTPNDKAPRPAISRQTHHYPRCRTGKIVKVAMECSLRKERDSSFKGGFEERGGFMRDTRPVEGSVATGMGLEISLVLEQDVAVSPCNRR
jgi:hypothetical protein